MKEKVNASAYIAGKIVDIVLLSFLYIWLAGGVTWHDHLWLKHGADPRRAAILVAGLVLWKAPKVSEGSWLLSLTKWFSRKLLSPVWRWVLLSCVIFWAMLLGVAQTVALRFTMYDVGIFHQILWCLTHGFGFKSTISGAGNFLLDHFSPSLVLAAMIFQFLGASPISLALMHPLFIFGGVAAWVYLAERLPKTSPELRQKFAACTLVFGLGFDSLWGNLRWGFHENSVAFLSFSWALALFLSEVELPPGVRRLRSLITLLLVLVAAGSKETLLLSMGFFLFYWGMTRERKLNGRVQLKNILEHPVTGFLFGLSVFLFGTFVFFEKLPHPADKNYFARYYAYLGPSLTGLIKTILFTPIHAFHEFSKAIGFKELYLYFKTLFLPYLGIPLLAFLGSDWALFWVVVPAILSAALSSYAPLRGSGFHYVLEIWPVFTALTLIGLSKLKSDYPHKAALFWAFLSILALDQDPWNQVFEYTRGAPELNDLRAEILKIPPLASVAADELTGPFLAGRPNVTRWPDLSSFENHCPQWLVLRAAPATGILPSLCILSPPIYPGAGWVIYQVTNSYTPPSNSGS